MFGLFKKAKPKNWEIELLRNVLIQLPNEIAKLFIDQIDEGLFRKVLRLKSDIPGYSPLAYNSAIYNKFYDKKGKNYMFSNIKVFDAKNAVLVNYAIYVSYGVMNGFSIDSIGKYEIDNTQIDTTNFRKTLIENDDYNQIASILTNDEKDAINPSDVYIVTLEGKDYYHIKDLEDGDFIGIDLNKKVYKITHDPYEIILLDERIEELLK